MAQPALQDEPRRSRGVWGAKFGRKSAENRPNNFRPDCIQVPSSRRTLLGKAFPPSPLPSLPLGPNYNWVPEGSLAENFGSISGRLSGKLGPQNPSRSTGLVLQCRLHPKSARQTNSNDFSWHQTIPARLSSGTQSYEVL